MRQQRRRRNSVLKKCWTGFLLLCFLGLSLVEIYPALLPGGALSAGAASSENSKEIAIVFDNSGSMYYPESNDAWCKATYAMEVFADMLNEGDTLEIYPMNSVETYDASGSRTAIYTMDNPISIRGGTDPTRIIENIISHVNRDLDTPIEAIDRAYQGLRRKGSDGRNQYLVILTDGDEFYEDGKGLGTATTEELSKRLGDACQQVNVLYVGIGTNVAWPSFTSSGESGLIAEKYKAENSSQILTQVTNVCNTIFGRITADQAMEGNQLDADIPLSSLIVFTQGTGGSSIAVSGSQGTLTPAQTYSPKYSTNGSEYYKNEKVDTSLTGSVVTYTNLPADTYTIQGTGSNTEIYYEPDVDLQVDFYKPDGTLWQAGEEIRDTGPGTYALDLYLADGNGNRLPDSVLLADKAGNATYTATYKKGDITDPGLQTDTATDAMSGGTDGQAGVRFTYDVNAGEGIGFGSFRVTYVNGYVIEKSGIPDVPGLDADGNLKDDESFARLQDHTLTVSFTEPAQDTIDLYALEEQGNYAYEAMLDGNVVPDAAFEAAISPGEDTGTKETGPGEHMPEITTAGSTSSLHYAAGGLANTASGSYILTVTASYPNPNAGEEGQPQNLTATAQKEITVTYQAPLLTAVVEKTQTAYTQHEMKEGDGKPITIRLARNGEPLTDEELSNADLTVKLQDESGKTLQTTVPVVVPGESAMQVTPQDGEAAIGQYHIYADVAVTDRDGILLTASTDGSDYIRVNRFPGWFIPLLVLLFAAIAAALITFFVYRHWHARVLPEDIFVRGFSYSGLLSGCETEPKLYYQHDPSFKKGSITLAFPPNDESWSCSCIIDVEPAEDAFRYKKSAERNMKVVRFTASPGGEEDRTVITFHNRDYVSKEGVWKDDDNEREAVGAVMKRSSTITLKTNCDRPKHKPQPASVEITIESRDRKRRGR